MMETQKQWVNVDGKWQHVEVAQAPMIPNLPQRRPAPPPPSDKQPPRLPNRSTQDTLPTQKKAPGLPARPPSDTSLVRRESNESISSTATAETFLSARSNGTSITSNSDRFVIRAPEYDPASLPKLPPRRTQEEKDAETRALLRPKTRKAPNLPSRPKDNMAVQPLERSKTQPLPLGSDHLNQPDGPDEEEGKMPSRMLPLLNRPAPGEFKPPVVDKARPPLPKRDLRDNVQPSLPPRREVQNETVPSLPQRAPSEALSAINKGIVPPPAKRSALAMGFGNSTPALPTGLTNKASDFTDLNGSPSLPTRPDRQLLNGVSSALADTPPAIPLASRPDLTTLLASKPTLGTLPQAAAAAPGACLWCRDFSGPDRHAARFPRASLPSQDLGWLAQQLTSPFPSATDKARVIFTWLHHNVAYDVVAFFNHNVKPSTPQSTFATGLAVCEGYAALFSAIALKAGLEAVTIGGHGKGYGYSPSKPGDPVPPYSLGHAWNAVKIDDGMWKLIDCCWGAGTVGGKGEPYKPGFNASQFNKSNDEFGLSHFPDDRSKQFRNDGRIITWEEYIMGNKMVTAANIFSGFTTEEGISDISFRPIQNPIVLSEQGPVVRFSFQKVCPHYDGVKNGKGPQYLHILCIDAQQGTPNNYLPFEYKDGVWWLDVPAGDLGKPGQKCMLATVNNFDNKDGRGLTIEEYRRKKGRVAMGPFSGLATWEMA